MPNIFARNVVQHLGPRSFSIGTNQTPAFEFGEESGNEAWLKAEFVGVNKDEPLFNGRLYHGAEGGQTTIIDNFPKSDVPDGWKKQISLDHAGYNLIDDLGNVIFSYKDSGIGNVEVSVKMYGSGGQIVANTTPTELQLYGISFRM